MVIRTLVPGVMLMLLLGAQAGLPGLASATCCPCNLFPSCQGWCQCRGTPGCSSCRSGKADIFQQHAVAITPSSDFSPTQEALSVPPSLPLVDQPGELLAQTRKRNRTIGDFTSRLMAGAEFRIKSWCPGSLDKSV
jgi:hypothetical protein